METINNKNIYDTVRINIKKYRKLKEMTQQELADAAYLSHGYIREIESLKMGTSFSLDAVEKIANGLGIEVKLLFEEDAYSNNTLTHVFINVRCTPISSRYPYRTSYESVL